MAVDPAIQQLRDQQALIADALYDVAQICEQPAVAAPTPLLQDLKTKVNALNPTKFTFPNP